MAIFAVFAGGKDLSCPWQLSHMKIPNAIVGFKPSTVKSKWFIINDLSHTVTDTPTVLKITLIKSWIFTPRWIAKLRPFKLKKNHLEWSTLLTKEKHFTFLYKFYYLWICNNSHLARNLLYFPPFTCLSTCAKVLFTWHIVSVQNSWCLKVKW